jgi:hypothetical protein
MCRGEQTPSSRFPRLSIIGCSPPSIQFSVRSPSRFISAEIAELKCSIGPKLRPLRCLSLHISLTPRSLRCRNGRNHSFAGELFHEPPPEIGIHSTQRRVASPQLTSQHRFPGLNCRIIPRHCRVAASKRRSKRAGLAPDSGHVAAFSACALLYTLKTKAEPQCNSAQLVCFCPSSILLSAFTSERNTSAAATCSIVIRLLISTMSQCKHWNERLFASP